MNDNDTLIRELRTLAHDRSPAPSHDVVAADVARGRTAVRRTRRTLLRSGLSAAAVTAVLGGVLLAQSGDPAPRAPDAAPPTVEPEVALVDYTGEQPAGYRVDQVPEGYHVVSSEPWLMVIAPEGDDGRGVKCSTPANGGEELCGDFVNRISVIPRFDYEGEPYGQDVSVHGRLAWLQHPSTGDGTTIVSFENDGQWYNLTSWDGVGLTDEQLVTLADGIDTSAVELPDSLR